MKKRERGTSLTPREEHALIGLLRKIRFPISPTLFEAWCNAFTVNPVELVVVQGSGKTRKVFLTYRNDKYWRGWHIPGSVLRPKEKIVDALRRIEKKELKFPVTKPEFFAFEERGTPRGRELALIFMGRQKNVRHNIKSGAFFSLTRIPRGIVGEHKKLLRALNKKRKDFGRSGGIL